MKKQTKTIQEQWLIFFFLNLNLVHSVLKTRLQYWIHTRVKEIVCMCVGAIFFILFYFQSLLNRLYRNATMATCILFSFGDGVLVYIIYIEISWLLSKWTSICNNWECLGILQNEKKKVLFLFLETVAVSFKWWVYEICRHGNCKVGVLGPFFSALGVEFLFRKQMYRNLYLGIKRGLLHRVEKVCRKKKVLNIVTALQKTNPISDLCLFLSPPLEWIYRSVHMM